jgi:hypothetical protein
VCARAKRKAFDPTSHAATSRSRTSELRDREAVAFAVDPKMDPSVRVRYVSSGQRSPAAVGPSLQKRIGQGVPHFKIGRAEFDRVEFPRLRGHLSAWPVWVGREDGVHVQAEVLPSAVPGRVSS